MLIKNYLDKFLFWDSNFEKLDVDKSPAAVIQRVADRGTDFQKEKFIEYYGFDVVRETMLKARYIMPLGIHFVIAKLDIPLTSLTFYKLSRDRRKDYYAYPNVDFDIDQHLCV
jgi:hypothetical protein